jgi:hypothetical protein
MAELITLEFEIDKGQLAKFDRETRRITEKALVLTVGKVLDRIEKATLIKDYTQNSKPSKPQGSTYIRIFKLQDSSRKQITRDRIPIEGRWEARAHYASYVIGLAEQQAEIHKGRWPSLELAINNVNVTISDDFDKAMKKVQK